MKIQTDIVMTLEPVWPYVCHSPVYPGVEGHGATRQAAEKAFYKAIRGRKLAAARNRVIRAIDWYVHWGVLVTLAVLAVCFLGFFLPWFFSNDCPAKRMGSETITYGCTLNR
jgi:hypothetical protein